MTINDAYSRAQAGETVTFRPRGSSMVGLVPDRAQVVVEPVLASLLETGDVVLVRVKGSTYLHKVTAVDKASRRVQIGNNRGRINGWTGEQKVAGICTSVDGCPRPGARAKAVVKP